LSIGDREVVLQWRGVRIAAIPIVIILLESVRLLLTKMGIPRTVAIVIHSNQLVRMSLILIIVVMLDGIK